LPPTIVIGALIPEVRSELELHGGTVTLDSVVGQGTVCEFPVAHRAEPQRTAA
jgi:signal transduction histidine kinase